MGRNVAIQMDPIGGSNIDADSTFVLALEAQAVEGIVKIAVDELERYMPLCNRVPAAVDLAHAAASELLSDEVASKSLGGSGVGRHRAPGRSVG